MIAAGTTNRTPTRSFLNCESPRPCWIRSLYITHAHRVNNATPKAGFHNMIGICAMKSSPLFQGSEWPARTLGTAACVLFALALSGPTFGAARKAGRPGRVQTGVDVFEAQKFVALRNKHVGLITNHTGIDSQGRGGLDCACSRSAPCGALQPGAWAGGAQ
jgi:hypothetical protein